MVSARYTTIAISVAEPVIHAVVTLTGSGVIACCDGSSKPGDRVWFIWVDMVEDAFKSAHTKG